MKVYESGFTAIVLLKQTRLMGSLISLFGEDRGSILPKMFLSQLEFFSA